MVQATGFPTPPDIERQKFIANLNELPIHILGEVDDAVQLPLAKVYHQYDAWNWRGRLWVKRYPDTDNWTDCGKVEVTPTPQYPEVDTDKLVFEEHPTLDLIPSVTFKGTWPHDEELPNVEEAEVWDGWMHKGRLWVKRPEGAWDPLPEFIDPSFGMGERRQNQFAYATLRKYLEDEAITVKGRWVEPILPNPHHFEEREALWKDNGDLWVNKRGVWAYLYMPREMFDTFGKGDISSADLKPLPAEEPVREDKGALARELMEQKAEVKRLRRARIKYLCFLWLVVLLIVGGFGTAVYAYIKRDLVIGRYSDARECSIKVGNLTITGKRTYSYPAYSLWGQRWVQESDVQEVTVVNLPGVRLDIIGDAEPKYWAFRFVDGDRGTQILKPALKYTFFTDKGLIMATYGGFCQAVGKQQIADDPKAPERSIID